SVDPDSIYQYLMPGESATQQLTINNTGDDTLYYSNQLGDIIGTWSIAGDWNCDGGPDFTVDFTFNDDGTFSYPDEYGQPNYAGTWGNESGTVELSAGVCDAVTFEFNAWVIFDYYLTTYYITHDGEQGFGVMDSEGDGSKDGDLLATRVSESTNQFTIDALHYDENSLEILGEAPDDISELSWVTIHDLLNREEELIEYRVYEVAADELDTLVATVVTDTFATVTASPNYLEHCYNVKAFWYTGDPSDGGYGQLESIASNLACTIPYKFGDADFDNDVDITDVLAVVDFILEEDVPTEDQIRNCDVNSDEEINIADVVMMVDIIFGGTGRIVGVDAGEIAYIDLKTDFKKSLLTFEIEYNGPVRGIEFELKFDPTMVNVMPPSLLNFQENVMISYTEKEPGILKVLAADLQGGHIEATDNSYMSIPVEFMGNERENSFVNLEGIKLAGADGSLINIVSRTNSSEVKVIPGAFALHQNFPNPFNPSTEIRFDLPEAGNVNLAIYNLMGQKIRTLSSDNMTPGYHAIIWDGTNDIGSQVATGMYFYSIQSSEFQATKKMLFLK
ncbi:MAG: T9SS type A sorting domain-containing protein, partial [Candidatus Marinimicrobia bacterium]|nr:T9SS type A sorting domain-containing protein [Candidatus Neomarinimicrobiota bacterium]